MKEFKTRLLSSIVYSALLISCVFFSSLSYLVVMLFLCLLTLDSISEPNNEELMTIIDVNKIKLKRFFSFI